MKAITITKPKRNQFIEAVKGTFHLIIAVSLGIFVHYSIGFVLWLVLAIIHLETEMRRLKIYGDSYSTAYFFAGSFIIFITLIAGIADNAPIHG